MKISWPFVSRRKYEELIQRKNEQVSKLVKARNDLWLEAHKAHKELSKYQRPRDEKTGRFTR